MKRLRESLPSDFPPPPLPPIPDNLWFYDFGFVIFRRCKFESANVLRTLRAIIKSLYHEQDRNQSVIGELLSLGTLYEMVLSHSQFLDVILSSDGRSNTKGDGRVTFAMSCSCCQFHAQNCAKLGYNELSLWIVFEEILLEWGRQEVLVTKTGEHLIDWYCNMTLYSGESFFRFHSLRVHKTFFSCNITFVQCRPHFIKHFTIKRYAKLCKLLKDRSS